MIKIDYLIMLLMMTRLLVCSSNAGLDRGYLLPQQGVDPRYIDSLAGTPDLTPCRTINPDNPELYRNRPEALLVRALQEHDVGYLQEYKEQYFQERSVTESSFPHLRLFPLRAIDNNPIGHFFATPDISNPVKRRAYRFFTTQLGLLPTESQKAEFERLHTA